MDDKGRTPLYYACKAPPERPQSEALGKALAVEMLLAGGVDPAISKWNRLPIHEAVDCGDLE